MDYLKMIEFLTQELVKRDEAVKQLTDDVDFQKSIVDRLTKLNDKHLADILAKEDAVGDVEANLHDVEDKLVQMTIEKDHWKEEALEYRNQREPEWWAKEKQYKAEIEKLKSSIIEINQDRVKVVGNLSDKIKSLNDEVGRFKADYLAEADYVIEKEEEIGRLNEKIKELNDKYKDAWATDFAYHHLKKAYDDNNSYYEERIAKLQVEINHLKHNK